MTTRCIDNPFAATVCPEMPTKYGRRCVVITSRSGLMLRTLGSSSFIAGASPVRLERDVSRLAAPMPPHTSRREHLLHVVDHRRVAAQHRMRVLAGQRQRDTGLEATVLDGSLDAPGERVGMRVAAHHRDVAKASL